MTIPRCGKCGNHIFAHPTRPRSATLGYAWPHLAALGREWPRMAAHGRAWPRLAAPGRARPRPAALGRARSRYLAATLPPSCRNLAATVPQPCRNLPPPEVVCVEVLFFFPINLITQIRAWGRFVGGPRLRRGRGAPWRARAGDRRARTRRAARGARQKCLVRHQKPPAAQFCAFLRFLRFFA